MTDFYSVLQRAVSSLPDGSGPSRRAVYDKARKALLKQLQSFDPPLPSSDVTAQRLALEDAIRKIENEIARQIRTKRALQNAIPANGGTARTSAAATQNGPAAFGEDGAGGQSPVDRAAAQRAEVERLAAERAAQEERAARRAAEAARQREEQAAMLNNAVSEAMAPDEPETLTTPPVPVPVPVAPPQKHPYPPADDAADAVMFEADPEFDDAGYHDAREAVHEPDIVDGEFDEVDPDGPYHDVTPTVDPKDDKRRRKAQDQARRDEERRLKAERRSARKAERQADAGARNPVRVKRERKRFAVGGMVLPVLILALLVGAAYAAYTQREALLAVLDDLQEAPEQRPPITVTGDSAEKNSDRLPSTLDGEDTRTVTTTAWPPREGAVEDGQAVPPPDRTVGTEVSPFNAAPPTTAEEQAGSISTEAPGPQSSAEPGSDDGAAGDPTIETAALPEASTEAATLPSAAGSPADTIGEFTASGTQQAVLYEEAAQQGEPSVAVPGGVTWSMVRQSIGGGEPEPVIRATAEILERQISATITVRENQDAALPASHLIEIAFDIPDGFEGGVKNVPGVIMKQDEQARGDALRGAAARVSSGLFWIALSESDVDRANNLTLLRERDWIDIPILYESGRRAILTLRKGSDGFQSVNAAIQAWSPG